MPYRIEKKDSHTILWDEESGVGLQFTEGERLQRYSAAIVMDEAQIQERLSTGLGVIQTADLAARLKDEAEKLYPMEFAEMP